MGIKLRFLVVLSAIGIYSCNNNLHQKSQGLLFKDVYSDSLCAFFFVEIKGGDYICKYMTSGDCCDTFSTPRNKFENLFLENIDYFLEKDSISGKKIEIEKGCDWTLIQKFDFIKKADSLFLQQYKIEIDTFIINQNSILLILKTSSLVADSVLGQGEALDCFNTKSQNSVALLDQIKVIEMIQQLETIQEITDPEKRAELYKKVFGACCDTPQTQIIS